MVRDRHHGAHDTSSRPILGSPTGPSNRKARSPLGNPTGSSNRKKGSHTLSNSGLGSPHSSSNKKRKAAHNSAGGRTHYHMTSDRYILRRATHLMWIRKSKVGKLPRLFLLHPELIAIYLALGIKVPGYKPPKTGSGGGGGGGTSTPLMLTSTPLGTSSHEGPAPPTGLRQPPARRRP